MIRDVFNHPMKDKTNIFVRRWVGEQSCHGIVQIVHGMAEHSARYDSFARFLTSQGFVVIAHDLRGHGQTAKCVDELGHFADEDGWERTVEDLVELTDFFQEQHKLPVYLLGHSMGSFLARRYAQKFGNKLSGLIMIGTGTNSLLTNWIALNIAKCISFKKGKRTMSPLLNFLAFGLFNRPFQPAATPFDWLSRDSMEVDKYMADPFCGHLASACFYCDLLLGLKVLDRSESLKLIPRDLPILILSGEKDPVGKQTKAVHKAYRKLQAVGLNDVRLKIYAGARHELLNELNRMEVYEDILAWLKSIKN